MNVVDIIILICCIPALIQGIRKGFISQAISLLSLVLGAWLSFKFAGPVGDFLKEYIDISGTLLHIIAFALILILVTVGLEILGKTLEKMVKFIMLGWLNKLLGAAFALIKVVLLLGVLAILIDSIRSSVPLITWEVFDESVLFEPVKQIANAVFPYLKELIFNK